MTHHGAALQKLINDNEESEKLLGIILKDYSEAGISDKEKEMLNYAEKLKNEPLFIVKGDIEKLKNKGFEVKDILELNQVVAYFNYVDRLADGLVIELEESLKIDTSKVIERVKKWLKIP